ncbi:MAG: endonuclease/exonuclease/phosphatase family protein, partial [Demequinaceae bacterium]|nr:endonuclease/exonuclease/phosphatase family protein [Demequinaceae bacterium]
QGRVLGLLVGTTWLTLDLIRASGPLLSHLLDSPALVIALATFGPYLVAGVLAHLATTLGRRVGSGWSSLYVAGLAVALRLAFPLASGATLVVVGLAALSASLALLLLAIRRGVAVGGGAAVLAATAIGGCAAILEQGSLHTWDAVWRSDAWGWSATALVSLTVLGGAWRARGMGAEKPVKGLWAVGIWLSLLGFALANLGYISSQAGIRLAPAIVLAVVGLAGGAILASLRPNGGGIPTAIIGAVALGSTHSFVILGGTSVIVALPLAALCLTYLTSRAVTERLGDPPSGLRSLGSAAVFGLAILVPFLAVQLDYDKPLGFPHLLVIVAAAAALIVGGILGASRPREGMARALTGSRRRAGLVFLAAVLIALPTSVSFNQGASPTNDLPPDLRVVSWNLHYGVIPPAGGGPGVDPSGLVDAIAAQDADVVLLQEVDRGWILGGGADLLQVLADGLGMNYVFLGTHDQQFGNAILSRFKISDAVAIPLPYGAGPQRRAAIAATIETSEGPIRVVSVHLQNHDDEATRVAQVEALLAGLSDDGLPTVVGGDFNATPESATVEVMLDSGFVSAQDWISEPADTYFGGDFVARLDYVFGRGVPFSDFSLGDSSLSDHLSLGVTVAVRRVFVTIMAD